MARKKAKALRNEIRRFMAARAMRGKLIIYAVLSFFPPFGSFLSKWRSNVVVIPSDEKANPCKRQKMARGFCLLNSGKMLRKMEKRNIISREAAKDRSKFLIIIQIIAGRLETAKKKPPTMGEVRKLTTTKRKLYNEVETKYMIYGCRASLADERGKERERASGGLYDKSCTMKAVSSI